MDPWCKLWVIVYGLPLEHMNVAIHIQHKFFKANEEAMLAIETRKTLFSQIVLWSPGKHHLSWIKPLKFRVSLHFELF